MVLPVQILQALMPPVPLLAQVQALVLLPVLALKHGWLPKPEYLFW
jgi:hypothetical protein